MEQREERASVGLPDGSWALPGVVDTSPQGMLASCFHSGCILVFRSPGHFIFVCFLLGI